MKPRAPHLPVEVFFQFSVIFPFFHLILPEKRIILYSVTVDETVRALYKPLYFSKYTRNRPSKSYLPGKKAGVQPVGLLYLFVQIELAGYFFVFSWQVLGRTSGIDSGSVRLFLFRFSPCAGSSLLICETGNDLFSEFIFTSKFQMRHPAGTDFCDFLSMSRKTTPTMCEPNRV